MIHGPLYLTPTDLPVTPEETLGRQIRTWRQEEGLPEVENPGIVLLGLPEDRYYGRGNLALSPMAIRWQLYHLADLRHNTTFLDAGDLTPGETLQATYDRLSTIIRTFSSAGWTILILGGGSDLVAGQYLALEEKQSRAQMVFVNNHLELPPASSGDSADWNHFLYGNHSGLLHYTHIGHQAHYTSFKKIDLLRNKHYDLIRLSEARSGIEETEPFFRDADAAGISMNALRYADAPASLQPSPNGFSGEEACQLSFYAGLSDRIKSFGIYDLDEGTPPGITTRQAAQIAWYFLEGVSSRLKEDPARNSGNIKKYIVPMDGKHSELVFYKSMLSDRWWMEIAHARASRGKNKTLIACSLSDYEKACRLEIPDRWWKWAQVIP